MHDYDLSLYIIKLYPTLVHDLILHYLNTIPNHTPSWDITEQYSHIALGHNFIRRRHD